MTPVVPGVRGMRSYRTTEQRDADMVVEVAARGAPVSRFVGFMRIPGIREAMARAHWLDLGDDIFVTHTGLVICVRAS